MHHACGPCMVGWLVLVGWLIFFSHSFSGNILIIGNGVQGLSLEIYFFIFPSTNVKNEKNPQ